MGKAARLSCGARAERYLVPMPRASAAAKVSRRPAADRSVEAKPAKPAKAARPGRASAGNAAEAREAIASKPGDATTGSHVLAPAHQLQKPDTRVYVGDSRELLRRVPECARGEVDLIFADPPFNWKREYDRVERITGEVVDGNNVWDDSMRDAEYLDFTRDWLDGCIAALKPEGSMWVNIPDDWAAEIVVHLKQRGMHMVNWCIWHYRFGQNRMENFINSKVHVLYFSKHRTKRTWNAEPILEASDRATLYADPRTWNKKEGHAGKRVPMDVWYGQFFGRIQGNNKERRHGHDNQIPEVYLERVIRCSSNEGELVLDPFLGSGTTCTVARELRRRSIGFEFSKANAASAFQRISKGCHRVKFDEPTQHASAIFAPRGTGRGQSPASADAGGAPSSPAGRMHDDR